jgi:hypothetical protein
MGGWPVKAPAGRLRLTRSAAAATPCSLKQAVQEVAYFRAQGSGALADGGAVLRSGSSVERAGPRSKGLITLPHSARTAQGLRHWPLRFAPFFGSSPVLALRVSRDISGTAARRTLSTQQVVRTLASKIIGTPDCR